MLGLRAVMRMTTATGYDHPMLVAWNLPPVAQERSVAGPHAFRVPTRWLAVLATCTLPKWLTETSR